MKPLAGLTILCAACAAPNLPDPDVVGPFTGEVRRFVVDAYHLPTDRTMAFRYGDDLDGDGWRDNQAGNVLAILASLESNNTHIADMIAAGTLASFVEIQADDPLDDESVGMSWTASPSTASVTVGGRLHAGTFRSNRTRTTETPVTATLHIAAFQDADPIPVDVIGLQVDIFPDGAGGYEAHLRGGIEKPGIEGPIVRAIRQMVAADPASHDTLMSQFDGNDDGVLSEDEILRDNTLVPNVLAPDIELFGRDVLSFGIGVHLSPCPEGNCALARPAAPCTDRVRDGDESDVDCGGSCPLACAAAQACSAPADCQSHVCDGRCAAPTCADGVADGFESDVDCGGPYCASCAAGGQCLRDEDCASFVCDGGLCR